MSIKPYVYHYLGNFGASNGLSRVLGNPKGKRRSPTTILAVALLSLFLFFGLPLVAGQISVRLDKVCQHYDYNEHSAIGNWFFVYYCSRFF